MIHGVAHGLFSSAAVLVHVETDQRLPAVLVHNCEHVSELQLNPGDFRLAAAKALAQQRKDETADDYGNRRADPDLEQGEV